MATSGTSSASQPELRRVVLDADINWKLAHELRKRGRDATALRIERMQDLKDGALIKTLTESFEPCVLVTWDNKMLKVHAAEIAHFAPTIAVIGRSGLRDWHGTEETYVRNAVHRWLHRIESQAVASQAIYTTDTIRRT